MNDSNVVLNEFIGTWMVLRNAYFTRHPNKHFAMILDLPDEVLKPKFTVIWLSWSWLVIAHSIKVNVTYINYYMLSLSSSRTSSGRESVIVVGSLARIAALDLLQVACMTCCQHFWSLNSFAKYDCCMSCQPMASAAYYYYIIMTSSAAHSHEQCCRLAFEFLVGSVQTSQLYQVSVIVHQGASRMMWHRRRSIHLRCRRLP